MHIRRTANFPPHLKCHLLPCKTQRFQRIARFQLFEFERQKHSRAHGKLAIA